MSRKLLLAILIIVLTSMPFLMLVIQRAYRPHRIWTVDDDGPADFHTIHEAINNANEGDTIYVKAGMYGGYIRVNKTVSLIGEGRNVTFIQGMVYIDRVADNVWLFGFTIQYWGDGIECNSSYNIIQGNCIRNTSFAITTQDGTTHNTVVDNLIINNWDGIHVYGTDHLIQENTIVNNTRIAIHTLRDPQRSDRIEIVKNNITNNWKGINICGHWNIVSENIIMHNTDSGIALRGSTENNVITGNIIKANTYGIMTVSWDKNNTIFGNTIQDNVYGLYLNSSLDNAIYHNNFVNNFVQAYNYPNDKINIWDHGYPFGGNYWSDYTSLDANGDGIGDVPYTIDAYNQDNYPLMAPYMIPEFPSIIILPLFMIATILAVLAYRRKHPV